MNEFELIERYFNWAYYHSVSLGVGDDCAIIDATPNTQTVTSVDTLKQCHYASLQKQCNL